MLHQGFSRASFDRASEIASVTRRVAREFFAVAHSRFWTELLCSVLRDFTIKSRTRATKSRDESAGVTSVLITPSLSISVSEVDLLT